MLEQVTNSVIAASDVAANDPAYRGKIATVVAAELALHVKRTKTSLWLQAHLMRSSGEYLKLGYNTWEGWLRDTLFDIMKESEFYDMQRTVGHLLPVVDKIKPRGLSATALLLQDKVKTKLRLVAPDIAAVAGKSPEVIERETPRLVKLVEAIADPTVTITQLEETRAELGYIEPIPLSDAYTAELPDGQYMVLIISPDWKTAQSHVLRRLGSRRINEQISTPEEIRKMLDEKTEQA